MSEDPMAVFRAPVVVKVSPPGWSERGWRMKPGDAVTVEWPGAHDLHVAVDEDGAVRVTGVEKETKAA